MFEKIFIISLFDVGLGLSIFGSLARSAKDQKKIVIKNHEALQYE